MSNPNLVRKISDSPSGSSGEISPASVISTSNLSKNYIINGDMRIAQRGTSFPAAAGSTYSLDRMFYQKNGAMVHTISQDSDVPTKTESGYVFANSCRFNLTTPDTSLAAGEFVAFGQKVEGYNFSQIAQKAFTLSFWVKATLPGTYCVSFTNSGADRTFVTEYNINNASTWEKKVITVLASPDSGTWNYANGVGLWIRWCLATGTNGQTGTVNSWITGGGMVGTTNQVNGVNTGANDFRITGIMLNEGEVAAPFKLFGESFNEELQACQRYYEKSYSLNVTPGTVTTVGEVHYRTHGATGAACTLVHDVHLRVIKRAVPSIRSYNPNSLNAVDKVFYNNAEFTGILYNPSDNRFGVYIATTMAFDAVYRFHWTADAEL